MRGELRRDLALDLLQGLARVGGEVEEHVGDAFQLAAARLQRRNGVGEVGFAPSRVIASTSARWRSMAAANAGAKCSGSTRKAGRP